MQAAAPGRVAALLAIAALALAGCADRPSFRPPAVDAEAVTRAEASAPRPPPPEPPPPPATPRLPPTPELFALPGGAALPRTAATPGQSGAAAPRAVQRRGDIPAAPIAAPLPAALDGCVIPPDAVVVRISANQPSVVTSEGRGNLSEASSAPRPTGFRHVAGTYRSRLSRSIQVQVARAGQCNVPHARIAIDLFRTIHIAREYPPGTCRHTVALAHEREHAAIDDALLRGADAWFGQPLRQELAMPGLLRGDPAALAAALRARFDQAARIFAEARQRAQLSIDTVEEYRKLTAACVGQS